jgi:hypothetical protein
MDLSIFALRVLVCVMDGFTGNHMSVRAICIAKLVTLEFRKDWHIRAVQIILCTKAVFA